MSLSSPKTCTPPGGNPVKNRLTWDHDGLVWHGKCLKPEMEKKRKSKWKTAPSWTGAKMEKKAKNGFSRELSIIFPIVFAPIFCPCPAWGRFHFDFLFFLPCPAFARFPSGKKKTNKHKHFGQGRCPGQIGTVPGTNGTPPRDKLGPVPGTNRPFSV